MTLSRTDTATFDRDVLDSTLPVLVEFTADWCGPCRAIAPVLTDIARERAEDLRVLQVDADANPELSIRFNVLGLPTVALFKQGEMVTAFTGARSKSRVLEQIDPHLP